MLIIKSKVIFTLNEILSSYFTDNSLCFKCSLIKPKNKFILENTLTFNYYA